MVDAGENVVLPPLPSSFFWNDSRATVRLFVRPSPISLVQRRGRTSATCSEAPQGAPRNKRARIQTLSPTSAPVSDESGNVTLDGPRERGNGDSDSSDIEPSTTREEDLALVSLSSLSS